ncbi:hypothetical protein CR513_51120, partial [Mucuna pruriens]
TKCTRLGRWINSEEQYVDLEIPQTLINSWKAKGYSTLHFCTIRLIVSLHKSTITSISLLKRAIFDYLLLIEMKKFHPLKIPREKLAKLIPLGGRSIGESVKTIFESPNEGSSNIPPIFQTMMITPVPATQT